MRQKASKGLNWGWIFRTDQHSGKCKAENDRPPSRKAKACSKKTSMMTKRENEKGGRSKSLRVHDWHGSPI
jgi:hypothetical protein